MCKIIFSPKKSFFRPAAIFLAENWRFKVDSSPFIYPVCFIESISSNGDDLIESSPFIYLVRFIQFISSNGDDSNESFFAH